MGYFLDCPERGVGASGIGSHPRLIRCQGTSNFGRDRIAEHVNLLLKRHYGPGQYVEVPDTDGGDCGLEGYSRDGCLYQCFAAEEPCPNDVLYKRQRKIARDLGKFAANGHKLELILGDVRIRRWILMVPHFESRHLIEYAVERTNEIRGMNLPYATVDFNVHVEASTFAVEERELVTRD